MNFRLCSLIPTVLLVCSACACQLQPQDQPATAVPYRDHIVARNYTQHAQDVQPAARARTREPEIRPADAAGGQAPRKSLMTMPATSQPSLESVLIQIPDPREASDIFAAEQHRLEVDNIEPRVVKNYQRVTEYASQLLETVIRANFVKLSLTEAVQRALQNNYTIRITGHEPAIAQTQVVEAEAAFDAAFFLDSSWDKRDPAVPNRLVVAQSDTRAVEGGIRQLLPTGLQASTSIRLNRIYQESLEPGKGVSGGVKQINPVYSSDFIATLRQPLLRGFGLDVNRAQLNVVKANHAIAHEEFQKQVRETLFNVEQAYWQLVRTRRDVTILAISVGQNWQTYQSVYQRLGFDATEVEVNNSKARFESRRVEFLESVKLLHDAEDALKFLLNDPDFNLSQTTEIVPTEIPVISPMAVDQFAEVRTALDERSEITQAKLNIEKARIQTQAAKNGTLPQLDLTFSYDVGGLGRSADSAFDNVTTDRFRSYSVALQFSQSIGNRGPRSVWTRAMLQEDQAVITLKQTVDGIVREINEAVRQLIVRFDQIPPGLEASIAAERNLRAIQARSQRIDPSFLETELSAVEQLNNSRRTLLQVVTDYNIAMVALERSKGTLLQYNNVNVTDGKGRN